MSEKKKENIMARRDFWEQRASEEGLTYGTKPSSSAQLALPYILEGYKVLAIGDAYGRNALFLAKHGAEVVNVDLCNEWIKIADRLKGKYPIKNICEDILNIQFRNESFNVIFANFVLHFFTDDELKSLFEKLEM
jgi:2-polyprenyl-3-methyl-5-hydroxy-6-metoxy-1,4-benzoquinol methylase